MEKPPEIPAASLFSSESDDLPDDGLQNRGRLVPGHRRSGPQRLVPRMPRQSVFRMVDRQHLPGSQVGRGLRQLIGQRMYIAPVGIVLPVFENGEVDLREALSDLREMVSVTAVAADIDLPRGDLQQERGPQRLIGIQPPAREVARCQAEDPDSLHGAGILVPVQFDDPLRSESPAFEMFADTQRTDDLSDAVFQFADRTVIEMVSMVVGDDEQVYRRHILRAVEVAVRNGPELHHRQFADLGLHLRAQRGHRDARGSQRQIAAGDGGQERHRARGFQHDGARLPQSRARNVNLGQKDSTRKWDPYITITLADNTQYPLRGLVDFADPQVDPETGTFSVRAEMANPDRILLPGQITKVRLLLDVREDATVVPTKSVVIEKGGAYVFVIRPDSIAERRMIKLGPEVDNRVIVERGVVPGEKIVVEGFHKLTHGDKVDPVPAPAKSRVTETEASEK